MSYDTNEALAYPFLQDEPIATEQHPFSEADEARSTTP